MASNGVFQANQALVTLSTTNAWALAASVAVTVACIALRTDQSRLFGGVMLASGTVALVSISDSTETKLPQFWGHVLPGILLTRAGRFALASPSGLLTNGSVGRGVFMAAVPLVIIVVEVAIALQRNPNRTVEMHNWVHISIDVIAIALIASASSAACLPAAATDRVLSARRLFDPVCVVSLGCILAVHIHDPRPFAVLVHRSFAATLVTTGLSQLIAALAHTLLPVDAPVCVSLRMLHAFSWTVAGLWLMMMAWTCYLGVGTAASPGGAGCGLVYAMAPRSDSELHNLLFAITMLASAAVVSVGHICDKHNVSDAVAPGTVRAANDDPLGYNEEAACLVKDDGPALIQSPAEERPSV